MPSSLSSSGPPAGLLAILSFANFSIGLGAFVVVFAGLCILFVPLLAEQLASFIDHVPAYVHRLEGLVTDHPWLKSILGPSAGGDKIRSRRRVGTTVDKPDITEALIWLRKLLH